MGRGKPPAPAIAIGTRQVQLLEAEKNKRTISVQFQIRIDIILRASQGQSNSHIARETGKALNTVKTWRKRWREGYDALCAFEAGQSGQGVRDGQLVEKMLDLLSDRPRSGAPRRITLSQRQQIVALACEAPEDFGIEMTQWNRAALAQVAVDKGIVETISPRYVSVVLKKTNFNRTNHATG